MAAHGSVGIKRLCPLYLTYARDSVAIKLRYEEQELERGKHTFSRREYQFQDGSAVGVTQYRGLFSMDEMQAIEAAIDAMDRAFEFDRLRSALTGVNLKLSAADHKDQVMVRVRVSEFSLLLCIDKNGASLVDDTEDIAAVHTTVEITREELCGLAHEKLALEAVLGNTLEPLLKRVQYDKKALAARLNETHLACNREQPIGKAGTVGDMTRTKFFFGLSYLWSEEQLRKRGACWCIYLLPCVDVGLLILAACRAHFTRPSIPIPDWIHTLVEARVRESGLLPRDDFVKMAAVNIYHTGNLGLLPHFDDNVRFQPPIITLQPFSTKRLCFGAQDNAMTNALFLIPMPRGSVTVMEKDSFAVSLSLAILALPDYSAQVSQVKHCVRPRDMPGKSGVVVLRNIPQSILDLAAAFDAQKARDACQHKVHTIGGRPITIKE